MSKFDVAIIGGGISGLSALHYLKRNRPDLTVRLFEAESRLGGTIGTDHIDGYSFDWGPNGFLDREPLTLELCSELGLDDQLERAGANVDIRYILRKGKLREVPMSPPKFLFSDVLSLGGKLRLMMEPFAAPAPDGDESIYDFVKRRIGRAAADYMVQPMVAGIYGGLADRLSLKSCFPIMTEMEKEYGGLFKAMIGKAKKARKARKTRKAAGGKSGGSGSPGGPGGRLTSFKGGLYQLIERFHERHSEQIETGASVTTIDKNNDTYTVTFADGNTVDAKHIVIATPSFVGAKMVGGMSSKLGDALAKIRYAPITVVCLGYDKKSIDHSLNGFGFLVPSKENLKILGSIWTSSIFENRAPDGHVQFRIMVGGDGDHESVNLSDDAMLKLVETDMDPIVGLSGKPDSIKFYRWRQGIPQFTIGHSEVMEEIESALDELRNIYVTGNAYYGIGLNDCIKQSHKVVKAIAAS